MKNIYYIFFFQAEDGIRDLVRSRGLGDVYKRQDMPMGIQIGAETPEEIAVSILAKLISVKNRVGV